MPTTLPPSQPSPAQSLSGFLITLAGAVLFSTKAILVKLAFGHTQVDALTLLTLRMLFSLPFYLLAAWLGSARQTASRLSRRQWVQVITLGLFGYYLSSLFDFLGLQYISAGLERLILFLYPTFAVLINAFVFRQRITPVQRWALVLTYAGILLAYLGELHLDTGTSHFFGGSLLIFACSITYSIYIAGSGRLIPQVGATQFTAYAMLAASAGVFLHFAISGKVSSLIGSPAYAWYGLALAILATVIPSFMLSAGMKKIGSNNVAIISAIGPVSTIVQANLVLGERIFAAQILGTLLVILGVVLIGWRSGKNLEKN
ncbi:MAG TPA: DMT family transporter [Chitinophagaceae bacterium]|nr:DMT family transporter [Chitinophagaceae bacterium]